MGEYPYDPLAYEKRYRRVYGEGVEFWEERVATQALASFAQGFKLPACLRAVDLGCGEGRDSIFLARMGFHVTAIDTAKSAIRKAKEWAKKEKLVIDFLVADVTRLPVQDEAYDLALNIACLHMMTDQTARDRHLLEAFRVLRLDGVFFSCNIGSDKSMSVKDLDRKMEKEPGDSIPRKVKVQGAEKEISLPIIAAWPKSKEQYLREFR